VLTTDQKRELERLVATGNKLEAIKQFRNMADVGLAEAKAFIDALEPGGHNSSAHEPTARNLRSAEDAALAAIRNGNLIEAIKRYRQQSRVGLKEARDAVEALSLMNRTEGRVNAKLARTLIELVAAGNREQALTQLMSNSGLDDAEARAVLKSISGIRGGAGSCLTGLVRIVLVISLIVLGFILWVGFQAVGRP
jgi:ribosomal protein L7/L12